MARGKDDEIRIGTSGWHYKHWDGAFYPPEVRPAGRLAWYARFFDTVEINNSFYRLPSVETMQAWRDGTPPGFLFAVKGSRFLTHMKKLSDPESGLSRLMPVADALGPKRGPILFQLPPNWRCNLERLAGFLAALPGRRRYAFEFRDPSWHNDAVYSLLRKSGAAFCIYHLAGFQSPLEVTARFVYVRLHGPMGKYEGSYSASELENWAARIRGWQRAKKGVYVYFDNDQKAFAARDALELKRLLAA